MIESFRGSDGVCTRIVARSNFSLSAHGLLGVVGALAGVTLALAGWLAWLGYWPILALAVLQMALVSWLLVRTWYGCWAVERIDVEPDRIRVRRQRRGGSVELDLPPEWARVRLCPSNHRHHPARVLLQAGRRRVELGEFLVEAERLELARALADALQPVSAWQAPPLTND